jgi:hypothetical protein
MSQYWNFYVLLINWSLGKLLKLQTPTGSPSGSSEASKKRLHHENYYWEKGAMIAIKLKQVVKPIRFHELTYTANQKTLTTFDQQVYQTEFAIQSVILQIYDLYKMEGSFSVILQESWLLPFNLHLQF